MLRCAYSGAPGAALRSPGVMHMSPLRGFWWLLQIPDKRRDASGYRHTLIISFANIRTYFVNVMRPGVFSQVEALNVSEALAVPFQKYENISGCPAGVFFPGHQAAGLFVRCPASDLRTWMDAYRGAAEQGVYAVP